MDASRAYKSLVRSADLSRVGPGPVQTRDAELREMMLGIHRRLRRLSAEMAAMQAAEHGCSSVYRALDDERYTDGRGALEKEQKVHEASTVAVQEAQLEASRCDLGAARSREHDALHDALEQAEAQRRHTHEGAMARKEQQVHLRVALFSSEHEHEHEHEHERSVCVCVCVCITP